jgi:hypothetical protein
MQAVSRMLVRILQPVIEIIARASLDPTPNLSDQDFPGGGGGVGVGGSGAGGFVICFIICGEADKSVSHVKLF